MPEVTGFKINGSTYEYDHEHLANLPTIDATPTANSANAVQSGGVWSNAFIAERQILQSGDNANNLTLAGSYVKPAANNVSNLPVQNSGILIVITRGTVVYQLYLSGAPNGGTLYYRKVGGDWKTVATSADTGAITDSLDALNTSIDSNFFKAFREAMADGADANDKTVAGAYAKPASRTISNIPSQAVGYLCVLTNGSDARQLYVTHNNIYHRTNGRDWHMLSDSRLFGKTLIALGDSLIYGQGLSADDRAKYTWTARLASGYGMTTYNYGVSGSSIAKLENGSGGEDAPLSMATRIDGIVTTHASDAVDYFVLEGGANDFNNTQNMGNLDRGNLDKTTFYGALNYIVNQVHATWPKARLLLMTNYDRKIRGTTAKNDETYVDAMVAFAKYRSIPVFDNYHTIGVSIKDYANPDYDPSTDPAEDKYLDNWFFPKALGQHLSIDAYEWVTPIYAQTLERI